MNTSALLILFTIALVALIDYVPRAFLKVKKPIRVRPSYTPTPDYLLLPTVYGNISYLQNIDFLKKYADKVIICTSRFESDAFYHDLDAVCREHGFRYYKANVPVVNGVPVRNAYSIYAGFFADDGGNAHINPDTPCILLDADTYAKENVNNLVRTFNKSKLHVASLRCEGANPTTVIERLQAFEYRLAMDNRSMDPWLTSGACNMALARVYKHVFANHSNFFAGGDIEIGKLASVMGYRVGHIGFSFYTALPNTLKDWYNQRVIWFAGGFRHHVTNIASYGWHHFFMLFYNSLLIYLLLPLRWIELVNFPLTMFALIILSWLYTYVLVAGKRWEKAYLLLPFYSAMQSLIILPVACVRYFKIAIKQRSLGRLHYDLGNVGKTQRLTFSMLNVASATVVIYAAISFTGYRIDYWMRNGHLFRMLGHLF